jgi:hypothetical protein
MSLARSWFAVDQAVYISLEESAHPEFSGRIVELCASGVRLRTDFALSKGSALQLTWKSTFALAEVKSCLPVESHFLIEVKLHRAFHGLANWPLRQIAAAGIV